MRHRWKRRDAFRLAPLGAWLLILILIVAVAPAPESSATGGKDISEAVRYRLPARYCPPTGVENGKNQSESVYDNQNSNSSSSNNNHDDGDDDDECIIAA